MKKRTFHCYISLTLQDKRFAEELTYCVAKTKLRKLKLGWYRCRIDDYYIIFEITAKEGQLLII